MTHHIGSCKVLSGAIRKYLVSYEGKKISLLPFAQQTDNSLPSYHPTLIPSKRIAFTLAEVLITLAIIGVVAALTMPSLISNHRKHIVETKLKRFYSTMNQAIQLSEIDNGPTIGWWSDSEIREACKAGYYSEPCLSTFFNKYYKNYIKYTKLEYKTSGSNVYSYIYFADGSVVQMSFAGHDYNYRTENTKHIVQGKNQFLFGFYPNGVGHRYRDKVFKNKNLMPYVSDKWDGTYEGLFLEGCHARIIMLNGWKIPDNYPIKF